MTAGLDTNVIPLRRPAGPQPLWRHVAGEVLRERRRRMALRLRDVAERAGVSAQYLSEVERGRKEASSEILESICGALDLRLLDLLRGAGRRLVGGDGSAAGTRVAEVPAAAVNDDAAEPASGITDAARLPGSAVTDAAGLPVSTVTDAARLPGSAVTDAAGLPRSSVTGSWQPTTRNSVLLLAA